ncbi:MAG: orotate phosphoribosyltransferase [Hyphomicrobiaceae bacterium]
MPNRRDREAARRRLIEIVRSKSFRSGEVFKLASGKTSTLYFNMKPTLLDPEGAMLSASLILDLIADDRAVLVGGLELGAVPIAASVAAVSAVEGRPIAGFLIRKQAKEHGTQSLVEGLVKGETLAGRRVVIVEDVTTTGGSALKAAEVVRAEGGEVARVVSVLDRQEGAEETFAAKRLVFSSVLKAEEFTRR